MIELKTLDKSRVNPVDDGVLYNALAGESGILTGCGLTAVGGAQVQIRDGYLILCGRVCKVSQEVLYANLSANGTQEGQLVTVIDLSNAENPIKFETRLPKGELMQGDINAGGTIYELEIATYTANELSVKSITTTANKIGLAKEKTLGQPSGIATLDSSGKLAQMPTAADVGAIKLCWSDLINETTATPNKYNFDDYITPGDVVSVDNYAGAQSIANIPEAVPGKLYVLPLRTDDQERNDLMQEYHTVTGNVWCRPRYYYSGNTWSAWGTSANCTRMDSGVYIDLPGGMHICVGSQTYTKVEINNQTNAGCYVSGRLYFNGFPKQYRYAPRCLISLSVGSNGPYWLSVDSNGPSTTRPQGFLLASTIGTTVATVTLSYFAIGIS